MLERIMFIMIAFAFFVYIFLYKMVRKNDTTYLWVLTGQAVRNFS